MKLSVVIPVYNEVDTIKKIVLAVENAEVPSLEKEIIIVDDGSTDGTAEILRSWEREKKYKIILSSLNRGKGAALRAGFRAVTGDFVIIQDADTEYDPREYPRILRPLLEGKADMVYGSRFMGAGPHRVLFFWHYAGNKIITTFSNMLTNLNLSDVETCYKAFTKEALGKILPELSSDGFGVEIELTARAAKHKLRVYEVGISYFGRTYEEGKKIGWRDGAAAIWYIIKYNILS